MRILVTYPMTTGRLLLRTQSDWDKDIEPVHADYGGATFDVPFTTPTLAVKPCLVDGDTFMWSAGPDYVLTAHDPDPQLFPFFRSPVRGRVSDVMHIDDETGTHAFRIYYPPGYHENTLLRFPVVYMQDGKNLFFPEEAFSGDEWEVDETMDRLDDMNAIRKTLVIGVAPVDRMREYTMPGAVAYGRFMVETLKPYVDAELRTRPGPGTTVVMGSSLGAVAAFRLAWDHPEQFGKAACLSGTFGHQSDLYESIATSPRRPVEFYLDSGWPRDNCNDTNAMRDLLVSRGWRLGIDLMHFTFPDAIHHERAWAGRLHLPFQFLLGRAWAASRGEI